MSETRRLPRHVGIIMDGNGRWAQNHGRPRLDGHRAGADSVKDITRASRQLGIEALTLYAFSTQTWAPVFRAPSPHPIEIPHPVPIPHEPIPGAEHMPGRGPFDAIPNESENNSQTRIEDILRRGQSDKQCDRACL